MDDFWDIVRFVLNKVVDLFKDTGPGVRPASRPAEHTGRNETDSVFRHKPVYPFIPCTWPGSDRWFRTTGGLRYYALDNYIPEDCFQLRMSMERERFWQAQQHRKFVWNFKYDTREPDPVAHAAAVQKAADRISYIVRESFGPYLRHLTFFCVPSSNTLVYTLRCREFSFLVCRATGMADAFDHFHILGSKQPRHLGGGGEIFMDGDLEWFHGRSVILFDDVITSGYSAEKYRDELAEMGARVIGGLFLARTVSPVEIRTGRLPDFGLEEYLKYRHLYEDVKV